MKEKAAARGLHLKNGVVSANIPIKDQVEEIAQYIQEASKAAEQEGTSVVHLINELNATVRRKVINDGHPITRDLKNAVWINGWVKPATTTTTQQKKEEDEPAATAAPQDASEIVATTADEEEKETKQVVKLPKIPVTKDNLKAMQRWVVKTVVPSTFSKEEGEDLGQFGCLRELPMLCMPFKQVYVCDFKAESLDNQMLSDLVEFGLAKCRDGIYQWQGRNAKERACLAEAIRFTLIYSLIKKAVSEDRFKIYAVTMTSLGFTWYGDPTTDCYKRPECLTCGANATNMCHQCVYYYCRSCLARHIDLSKNECKCKNPSPACQPCKYQKRIGYPKVEIIRTRPCYGSSNSNASGCPNGSLPPEPPAVDDKGVSTSGHGHCPGCHVAYYCSRKCQEWHWKEGGHRERCRLWKAWKLKYGEINKQLAKEEVHHHHQSATTHDQQSKMTALTTS
jgi:hypothetical protein